MPSVLIDQKVAAFALPPIEGRARGFSSDDLQGQVSLVNVFGSWCVACQDRASVPHAAEAARASCRSTASTGGRRIARPAPRGSPSIGDPYTLVGDDPESRAAIAFGVTGAPETFVVDAEGMHPLQARRADHPRGVGARRYGRSSAACRPADRGCAALLLLACSRRRRVARSSRTRCWPIRRWRRARARSASELRCLVCQNQSIDESDADLARDLRVLVRERLQAGDSDRQVVDYVVSRYGDFVLLRPPLKPATYALWFGPALILSLGRRRNRLLLPATGRQARERRGAAEQRRRGAAGAACWRSAASDAADRRRRPC